MNTPQDNTPSQLDEVEDLTLFADESFDTDDVDLFEFTGEDDAPLTRLKSIILSLDWEINDDILQELNDEIGDLQQMWQGDKVAKVYLQGLGKIGNYLRMEGAYAHPNAIKLLLTFFYDFEKIISSHEITGDTITALLKADVRKFKILQYQINQTKGAPTVVSSTANADEDLQNEEIALEDSSKDIPEIECEPLTCLKATILGLEWEVTDKGLDQFNSHIADVREHFMDNKAAHILIQGLQALGGYITDERANAHPESFSLLHSFYEGLELLLEDKKLSDDERQDILVDRVNRLNNLKSIIATAPVSPQHDAADDIIDEVMSPVEDEPEIREDELLFDEAPATDDNEDELSLDFTDEDFQEDEASILDAPRAAMETADMAYPDDVLDPTAIKPVDIDVADEFIEEELSVGTEITPALSGADETTVEEEEADSEIAEGLDLFFGDDSDDSFEELTVAGQENEDAEELELSFSEDEDDSESPEATALSEALRVNAEESDEAEEGAQLFIDDEELTFAPALDSADGGSGFDEEKTVAAFTEEPSGELDDKLNAFFGSDDDELEISAASTATGEEPGFSPALDDTDEDSGFDEELAAATMPEDSSGELDDKLDAFFGSDEETSTPVEVEEELAVAPALGDTDEESGFSEDETVAALTEESTGELDDKLNAFFGSDEEKETVDPDDDDLLIASALDDSEDDSNYSADETVAALSEESAEQLDDKLDALFGSDEDKERAESETAEPMDTDDLLVAPALGDTDEEGGFNEGDAVSTLTDESTGELDNKLDSFFGSDDETETAEVETGDQPAETNDLLVSPALGGTDEEGGFSENEAVATFAEDSTNELEDKLDSFFGSDEEDEEQSTDVIEEEPGTELDEQQETLFTDDESAETETSEESIFGENASLLALAGGLSALAAGASTQQIEKSQQLVRDIQQESGQTTEQKVLLQLVHSVLTLLPDDTAELPEGTSELTEYLYEQIASEATSADTLVAAIERCTDWQKNVMREMLSVPQATQDSEEKPVPGDMAAVTSEVRSGFESLRSALKEEFSSLRETLK